MVQENCRVTSIEKRSSTLWEASLYSPAIVSTCKPGQFINVLPSHNWSNVMRRPMSIAGIQNDDFIILFKVIGPGTYLMEQWCVGDSVDCIGPLGNSWTDFDAFDPILVGGGVGLAPILYLSQHLKAVEIPHFLIAGAREGSEHFLSPSPEQGIWLTTDDGSLGIPGNIVNGLKQLLTNHRENLNPKIFCCGPPAMNRAIAEFARGAGIPCSISVETLMACGTGICQGCAVEMQGVQSNEPTYRNHFTLACLDGPIFPAEKLY